MFRIHLVVVLVIYLYLLPQTVRALDFGKIIGDIGRSFGIHTPDDISHKTPVDSSLYVM